MANTTEQSTKKLLDQVAKAARKGLKGRRADLAADFARAVYEHVPPDDILEVPAGQLAAQALGLLDFATVRKPGKALVRVIQKPRLEKEGWAGDHSVVEVVNDDMPFLVDSVTSALDAFEGQVFLVIHPIVEATRDKNGRLSAVHRPGEGPAGALRESVMQIQISEQLGDSIEEIRAEVQAVLADVRAAVEDWPLMRHQCRELIADLELTPPKLPADEIGRGVEFLKWLDDEHFTYLGFRQYAYTGTGASSKAQIDEKTGLGVLRNPEASIFRGLRALGKLPPDVREFLRRPELLRISKSNTLARVHRRAHMDTISIKTFDKRGQVTGERLFVGLFTSIAYTRSPRQIPLLREKVERIVDMAGLPQASHDGKALMHILETYPRDELFQIDEETLFNTALGVLHLQGRQRLALFVRLDPFERFVSALVYVPRDRFDTNLRLKLQAILAEAYNGEVANFTTHVGDSPLARLHIILRTQSGEVPKVQVAELESRMAIAARAWIDSVERALVAERGEQNGMRALRRFSRAFPSSYQEHFDERKALADIALIEECLADGQLAMDLYRADQAQPGALQFKILVADKPVPLSDVLPMLENMGLRVIGEAPYNVEPEGTPSVWIHDFGMSVVGGAAIDLEAVRDAFHAAFAQVWRGLMEDDGFNKLVLLAGLTARQVTVLRAYAKYLRQAAIPFSQEYMEETLARNPKITRALSELFEARFEIGIKREKAAGRCLKLRESIVALLEDVSNLDEDRIIRRFLNAIESTLRTNFHQTAEDGSPKAQLSFKLDSQAIEELPLPRPFREIFVYSPAVEGVHLRFGKVARGGLRWSDRREDFRTEILGLVKAQQVKNAVIVPVGSKGGFVVKRPPAPEEGRDAFQAAGIACYRSFIAGLLDITDNLKGVKVVPPANVVRWDEDDPYLVVAADKGTATFSDIANAVSVDYGHWLDDAFASGGSAGYDHKKMGITARGAWESVKRHFRELGKDIQTQDFTCLGVGDMSGDVFGNGMLLSKHIKLIGAFNHLHIFIDPDPDPARTWEERNRMFALPRSSWSDYDVSLISKGGGIFDRKAKSITLSPEVKALYGIEKDSVTPNELIGAMLRAEVELLWFGGIGTYIKASGEGHLEVGDRANDAIRIDSRQLRTRVVGEGANLGMTQRARIEFGLAGGKLNTDSIDNSAGVDCSDHEVNIKILLGAVEQAGDLTRKQRDKLLERMTDEVGDLVLRDNYLQSQAISVTHQLGAHLLDREARFMRGLEKAGLLSRPIEYLPDDETVLERQKQGIGLTRPELAVVLSYAKITLYEDLLASDLPDDPFTERYLVDYFPTLLRQKYLKEIGKHRLKREIVATVVTNEIVNRLGPTFVHEVGEKTGMPPGEIARAYMVSAEAFRMPSLWRDIEALDNKVPASLQASMLIECGRLIDRAVVWFLREVGIPLDVKGVVGDYGERIGFLMDNLENFLQGSDAEDLELRATRFREEGAPVALARRIASLALLSPACDIVRISLTARVPVEVVARTYFQIGARFGFDWLRRAAGRLPTDTAWDKLAVTAIVDDLFGHQGELTTKVLDTAGGSGAAEAVVDVWTEARKPQVTRTEQLLTELQTTGTPDFAMLAVINRQLKSMVAG